MASRNSPMDDGRKPGFSHPADTPAAAVPAWEWSIAVLGAVLVVAMIGYMGYVALYHDRELPSVVIEAEPPQWRGQSYTLRFRATNQSGATAAMLRVRAELRQGDTVVEASEAVLDYLPGDSVRYGGLFFRNDPSRYELRIQPVGYNEP